MAAWNVFAARLVDNRARRPWRGSKRKQTMAFQSIRARAGLNLLELDQGAAEILGMEEQYRLVVSAEFGLAVAKHARAFGLELVARGNDVFHLVADMVHAASRIALEEVAHR